MKKDLTALLPDGSYFDFWEQEQVFEKEYHVNNKHPQASDDNDGSLDKPFKTIQAAADLAEPGTRVLIHGGTYRECVRPRKGGQAPNQMVCYEAYGDGEAVIKASVVADKFYKSEGWNLYRYNDTTPRSNTIQVWATNLVPEEFQGYNPFCTVNILHDRLFIEYDKTDMTTYLNRRGMIFCDGKPLHQVPLYNEMSKKPGSYWVEANGQTVHFRLEDDGDPRDHLIELTSREQCFAPDIPFLSYIKVKGLVCAHAATGAPVPQRGAISAFRGHHWIIEDCKIDWSNCVGIDIGNECWHHTHDVDRNIGTSIIRGCEIYDVGVCGIAGLFAKNLLIEDNLIQGTGWQKMELSWEAGGIKVHDTVNSLIRRNIFKETYRADHLWMDVANVNNRITQNLFLDGIEQREAIFVECSRDSVNLIDNNIFWNIEGRFNEKDLPNEPGSSGWYKMEEAGIVNGYAVYGEGTDRLHIANNFIGKCRSSAYFAKPVSFRLAGRGGTSRNAVIKNNIIYDCKEAALKLPTEKNEVQGNLYLNQPDGYLRILYPQPPVCLDLAAWQEFYGFDKHGQEGLFTIEVDTANYTIEFKLSDYVSPFPRRFINPSLVKDYKKVNKVEKDNTVPTNFYGEEMEGDTVLPGPFTIIEENSKYSIDPRKRR
jgi:hypothetical protein